MLQSNFYRIFCSYLKEKHLKKPKISRKKNQNTQKTSYQKLIKTKKLFRLIRVGRVNLLEIDKIKCYQQTKRFSSY